MKMPPNTITVPDIAGIVGTEMVVEVMDVESQLSLSGWTMSGWADYFTSTVKSRLNNVISLEVSKTPMLALIQRPSIVRSIDWIDMVTIATLNLLNAFPVLAQRLHFRSSAGATLLFDVSR